MKTQIPRISVILPFYNAEKTLKVAIRSVIYQTFENWELILVNDCSNDQSLQIANSFSDSRIRLVSNTSNMGLAGSLNVGLSMASAPYIARMDADDVCYPERFTCQLNYLEQHPEVDVAGTSALVFMGDGIPIKLLEPALTSETIKKGLIKGSYPLYHPTWMAKASWFHQYLYDPSFVKAQDFELLARSCVNSTYANIPMILLGYREGVEKLSKRIITRRYVLNAQKKNILDQGRPLTFIYAATITILKLFHDLFSWYMPRKVMDSCPECVISERELASWRFVFNEANQ